MRITENYIFNVSPFLQRQSYIIKESDTNLCRISSTCAFVTTSIDWIVEYFVRISHRTERSHNCMRYMSDHTTAIACLPPFPTIIQYLMAIHNHSSHDLSFKILQVAINRAENFYIFLVYSTCTSTHLCYCFGKSQIPFSKKVYGCIANHPHTAVSTASSVTKCHPSRASSQFKHVKVVWAVKTDGECWNISQPRLIIFSELGGMGPHIVV